MGAWGQEKKKKKKMEFTGESATRTGCHVVF